MIYITGDTHGGFQRFGNNYFPQQKHMSREDYVIITGDFGGLWDGGPKDWYWLDWLSGKPFTTLFVDGNHENFDLLNALPEKEWHGGRVHEVRENILHLMRGQIFTFGGLTWFTMGGASSHDLSLIHIFHKLIVGGHKRRLDLFLGHMWSFAFLAIVLVVARCV